MLIKQLRKIKYYLLKLLRIKDNAHSISLGFSIGVIINFIPSFGIGPFLSTAIAKLLKGNPISGFIGGISFIWMFPILFYINIVVGETLLPIELEDIKQGLEDVEETLELGIQIGKAFLLGMIMNLIIFGIILYILTYVIIKKYQKDVLMHIYKNWKFRRRSNR